MVIYNKRGVIRRIKGIAMFSCARVHRDLIIKVNFKRALICAVSAGLLVVFLMWAEWIILVHFETNRLRREIQQSVTGAMVTSMRQVFTSNHTTLLQLEECQTKLQSSKAISSDLAKMMNKKLKDKESRAN